jgi:FHA domain
VPRKSCLLLVRTNRWQYPEPDGEFTDWSGDTYYFHSAASLRAKETNEASTLVSEPGLLEAYGFGESDQSAVTEVSVHWTPPAPVLENTDERSLVDAANLTILKADLDGFRRPIVAVKSLIEPESSVEVSGMRCVNGHFTDAARPACMFCSSDLDFDRGLTTGQAPALGTIALVDGREFVVDRPIVIGRLTPETPDSQDFVAIDGDPMMSRRHAEIRPDDWAVVVTDLQSANGVFLEYPSGRSTRLRANIPQAIESGVAILLGQQRITFHEAIAT